MATQKTPAEEPVEKISVPEILESLNEWDDIAVEKAFGTDPTSLLQSGKQTRFLRSLAFINYKRDGMNDMKAKQAAMATTIKTLNETFYFPEESADDDGADAAGEDGNAESSELE